MWRRTAAARSIAAPSTWGRAPTPPMLSWSPRCSTCRPINPRIVETQLSGAAVMQLGFTMQEKIELDSGQITNASFADYKIPSILDIPADMTNEAVEADQSSGPFGAKGVGESGTFGVS